MCWKFIAIFYEFINSDRISSWRIIAAVWVAFYCGLNLIFYVDDVILGLFSTVLYDFQIFSSVSLTGH